jgi:D-glycero-alpha-D-manno-heptose 1-phosphate guanylyltransferase
MECIILAGGLGTRLQGVIGDAPKCMAPVNGKPFLQYLLDSLAKQNYRQIILSLGFKHEAVLNWLNTLDLDDWSISYVIEKEPLGTGGGISLAMAEAMDNDVIVLNGDTMYRVELDGLASFHVNKNAEVTLALKEMHHFDRYGVVKTDSYDCISAFEEKKYAEAGYINGGVYVINKEKFLKRSLPAKYSFEKDYLEKFVAEKQFYGFKSDAYFIDIGIPEDYSKAQDDFKNFAG